MDIELIDEGTNIMFRPCSDAGCAFLSNEVATRNEVATEGWQWLGEALCVDRRMAAGLAAAAVADGLEISGEAGMGGDDEADQ